MIQILIMMLWGAAVFLACFLCAEKIMPKVEDVLVRETSSVRAIFERQLVEMRPEKIKLRMIIDVCVFFVLDFIFVPTWPLKFLCALPAVLLGLRVQRILAGWRLSRYLKKFEEQFVDGLTLISNAVKSGLSLQQAFEMTSTEMPKPFSDEFKHLLSEVRLGASVEDALRNMERRIRLNDLRIVVSSICILRETGGNIIETFQKITATIRERQKVHGKIRVLTTQGIAQGTIIFCMPFVLSLVLYLVSPDFILPLFIKPLGWILIFVALFLQAIGAVMMKKIVMIRV